MSPSFYHSAIMAVVASVINNLRRFRAFTELTIVIGDKDYTPDISVYPWKKVDYYSGDIIKMKELPLLAIEILSPTQGAQELFDKAKIYLQAGIQSVWIVQPLAHTISVLNHQETKHYHEGMIQDITGITLNIATIFDEDEDDDSASNI
ncbi:hypothetical protein U14_00282 [Candidatus Moduliflexus flocculans]|uniref:Putative restriction endonuclease domain-containing protein n=1 Tax=Candidatus Moduliflexus flocculans TaxID=1499966 RepID=A0A0S6VPL7_9BACT|nr:hypothetical protein U14_00282 [Candidatus Moduliflexus flocculans]